MSAVSNWVTVIPVKGTSRSKSRLAASPELAMAIALDTVEAALGATRVIVVTSLEAAPRFAALGATVVADPGGGLNSAISYAIATATATAGDGHVAVLLGDLPALTPEQLADALALAERYPRAMVADAEGEGTVLTTVRPGEVHAPHFGAGSRSAHLAAGYRELDVPADSALRRDVDRIEDLVGLVPGSRTAAALREGEGVVSHLR